MILLFNPVDRLKTYSASDTLNVKLKYKSDCTGYLNNGVK